MSPEISPLRRLWGFHKRFHQHRKQLIPGLLAVPLVAAAEISLTVVIGNTLTRLRDGDDTRFLAGTFGLLLAIAATGGLFRFLQRWLLVGVSRRFEVDLKRELFNKLCRLPLRFHAQSRSGDIVSRSTSDIENLRMLLGPGLLMYVLSAVFMVPGALYVMFGLSAKVTFSMMLPLVLTVLAMKLLSPRLHRASVDVQESLGNLSHRAQESFSGTRVVKGYGLEKHEEAAFEKVSGANRDHQLEMASARGMMHSLVNLSYDLTSLPIIIVGGLGMTDHSLDVGDLFKFIDLAAKVFWPMIALGWMAGLFPRAVVSATRIEEVLDEDLQIDDPQHPIPLDPVRGALSLRDVSYRYADQVEPALAGINVQVPAGTTLGVVGPTGSGKSTLLNMFGRLLEPDGELTLDGIRVQELALDTLRGSIAYVPQDSFMFSDTYRNNIEFGSKDELSESKLRELIELAGMTDEVARFPDGLNQMIGERGVTLSGGQRQRTCIARALAREPRILILDDALSAVDTETEVQLKRSLRRVGEGRTVILAAHRLGTVRDAETIMVLAEGRVEAIGTHSEVLERSAWYRETWNRQRMQDELGEL